MNRRKEITWRINSLKNNGSWILYLLRLNNCRIRELWSFLISILLSSRINYDFDKTLIMYQSVSDSILLMFFYKILRGSFEIVLLFFSMKDKCFPSLLVGPHDFIILFWILWTNTEIALLVIVPTSRAQIPTLSTTLRQ